MRPGRVLFDVATQRELAQREGRPDTGGVAALGDVVMIPSVKAARDRGVLRAEPMLDRLTSTGVARDDGTITDLDAIIWCTGFRPAVDHLAPLGLSTDTCGHPRTDGTRSIDEPRLHLLGYGDWTGAAAATLIGAGRTARTCVEQIIGRPARKPEPVHTR